MDYYSTYNTLCLFFETDVSYVTLQYIFVKCNDCNDMYVDEYYECQCNIFRCKHHAYLKTITCDKKIYCNSCNYNFITKFNYSVRIKCIRCHNVALYGYKDIICYCDKHNNQFGQTIYWRTRCREINYPSPNHATSFKGGSCTNRKITIESCNVHMKCTDRINYDGVPILLSITGEQCYLCKKKYATLIACRCNKYCIYCLIISTWKEDNEYVCNKCNEYDHKKMISRSLTMICHYYNCNNLAVFGIYGIILFCEKHINEFPALIFMQYWCTYYNCYKRVVDTNKRCFDHTTDKMRKKIMYMIS